MTNFIVSWLIQAENRVTRLLQSINAGKYDFDQDFFDHTKYDEQRKQADGKGEKVENTAHISVSWQQTSDDSSVERDAENELKQLLKFLTLETGYIFTKGSLVYRKLQPDGSVSPATVSFESIIQRNPEIETLDENELKKAVELKEKFDLLGGREKEFLLRALIWYERGTKEIDRINSYANYWIGFESLSSIFGKGPPFKCQNCGQQIQEESISKRMQEFLNTLGMKNRWKEEASEMYTIRNKLFHESKWSFDPMNLVNLRKLLKDCIESYLLNFT